MKRDFHAPGRSAVYAANAMAATSMPQATLAALDVMRAGGNALDAAICAAAVLGVVEPQSTGIGGDCFCLYAPAGTGQVIAINGSGRAPRGATPEALRAAGLTAMEPNSPHSVTVPGAVSAWEALNRAHGRKGFDELLQPAIRYAEEGFHLSTRVASDWANSVAKLAARPAAARHFLKGGAAFGIGDRFIQPALGTTLRAIARDGARAFYEGEVAADMVATLRAAGGTHTGEDFARGLAGAEFVQPITRPWQGLDIYQCPPNGSGLHVLMILGLLEQLGTAPDGPLGVTRLHRHIEAARLAYRDRDAFLADPAQVDVPVGRLISDAYLYGLAKHIRDDRAIPELPPAGETGAARHKDTVYLCTVDADGNACSFINSLFEGFGGGILAERSGIMLHNRGYGFRLEEGHPNCIAPDKRPMHTIIPGMAMRDGRPVMPYGVMGGHFQPMGQTLFLSNLFEHGLDVQEALDAPRLFPRLGKVQVERGIPSGVVDGLNRLGHLCEPIDNPHGGGSDPRKDGCALGY